MIMNSNTPVIVGVAEVVEHLSDAVEGASSAQELAGQAATLALQDTGCDGVIASEIDVVIATRTFPDSTDSWPMPFGKTNNMPRSIANRVGANPERAIYSNVGGNSPQRLVNEWAEALAAGTASMVLLAGAEVIASTKAAMKAKVALDWAEQIEGSLEDRGIGMHGMMSFELMKHMLVSAPLTYALFEVARATRKQQGLAAYSQDMAALLAPMSEVAAHNPYAMFPRAYTSEEIATPSEKNGYIAFPYTRAMVAKDGVNQAAAVLLTTVGKASELGIDESKWVYLHAYADSCEKGVLERPDLSTSPALTAAYQAAVQKAGISGQDLSVIDVYSCFPVVVSEARSALGLEASSHPMTATGGLSFFGGPGNNYSMHAIASVARKLRQSPQDYGLVGANGGMMHKHSVGVYSCRPGWQVCDSSKLQASLDEQPSVPLTLNPQGLATVESYSIQFAKGNPAYAVVVGRLEKTGERFVANNFEHDTEILQALMTQDMVGKKIHVCSIGKGNRVALTEEAFTAQLPAPATRLREDYQFCSAVRNGHILEVTINRPEAMNSLHPMAHEELAEIFDLYEADPDLWVAIITGSGDKAFCTGNDLKYSASGKSVWIPKSGFGGITTRRRTKLVIAAVNGYAMGGGMEIALACDIVIAAENAIFALPEVKVGLIAGAGGVQRLTRQIPLKQALDLLVTGRQVPAAEAKSLGFVNRVVPAGEVMPAAREYAASVCENSPSSVRLTLELLTETSVFSSVDDAVSGVPKALDKLFTSEDRIEGPKAFAEKRKPRWTGR